LFHAFIRRTETEKTERKLAVLLPIAHCIRNARISLQIPTFVATEEMTLNQKDGTSRNPSALSKTEKSAL
jgi:hypothetical protein